MSSEKEPPPQCPHYCPGPKCKANLEEGGVLFVWSGYAGRVKGHIESDEEGNIKVVLDGLERPPQSIRCASCGRDLKDLLIGNVSLDRGCGVEDEDNGIVEGDGGKGRGSPFHAKGPP